MMQIETIATYHPSVNIIRTMDIERNLLDCPIEVLENIVRFMDGESLIICGNLCSILSLIINKPNLQIMKAWKRVCLKEIPEDFLIDLLQKLYPKYWMHETNIKWNMVFKTWRSWKYLPNWSCSKDLILEEKYEITCMFVSGEWLLIGTKFQGCLFAYNSKTCEKQLLFKGANVLEMQVYCTKQPMIYLDELGNEVIEEFDEILPGILHDEAVLNLSIEANLHVDLRTGKTLIKSKPRIGTYRYRRFEDKELILRHDHGMQIVELKFYPTGEKYNNSETRCLRTKEHWEISDIWKSKVLLVDSTGYMQIMDLWLENDNNHPIKENLFVQERTGTLVVINFNIWHCNVIVQLHGSLSKHEIRMIIGGELVRYFPFQELYLHVTCVEFYIGILFLGTDLGSVIAYRVESEDELLHLDMNKHFWKFDVCQDPIVTLAIKQTEYLPEIMASTRHNVHLVTFTL